MKLVTPLRKNMKNALMDMGEKLMLRKRSLIETVNDHLKNVCQIEHSRHPNPANFLAYLMAGLAAYACSRINLVSEQASQSFKGKDYPKLRC